MAIQQRISRESIRAVIKKLGLAEKARRAKAVQSIKKGK